MAKQGAICLSEDAYRQVKGRLDLAVIDLGPTQLKNIAEPIRVYSLRVGVPAQAKPAMPTGPPAPKSIRRSCRSSQRSPYCLSDRRRRVVVSQCEPACGRRF